MDFIHKVKAAVLRELRLMRQRPIYLLASVGVMAFCTVFFLTFLKDGMPDELPIGVVDNDNSSLSRNFIRQLDATQLGSTVRFGSYRQAREALQTGKINAFCVIPEGMYEDVLSGGQPVMTLYVNSLYFVGGALAYKDLLTMANLSSGAVQREVLRAKGMNDEAIMGQIQPVVIDAHQIGNTATDYGVYLTNVLLPGILEMIIILVTVYTIGAELKYGTSRHLMDRAGGSMSAAMLGKLIPYTILYTAIGIICDLILYHWAGFPMAGSIWNMFFGTFIMVLACEAVAIFIIGTLPVLRVAISIAAMFSTLAFSLTGFTFPVESMPPYIQGLSAIFPLRHYYEFHVHEAILGNGFAGWHAQMTYMLMFLLLPSIGFFFLYRHLMTKTGGTADAQRGGQEGFDRQVREYVAKALAAGRKNRGV